MKLISNAWKGICEPIVSFDFFLEALLVMIISWYVRRSMQSLPLPYLGFFSGELGESGLLRFPTKELKPLQIQQRNYPPWKNNSWQAPETKIDGWNTIRLYGFQNWGKSAHVFWGRTCCSFQGGYWGWFPEGWSSTWKKIAAAVFSRSINWWTPNPNQLVDFQRKTWESTCIVVYIYILTQESS